MEGHQPGSAGSVHSLSCCIWQLSTRGSGILTLALDQPQRVLDDQALHTSGVLHIQAFVCVA